MTGNRNQSSSVSTPDGLRTESSKSSLNDVALAATAMGAGARLDDGFTIEGTVGSEGRVGMPSDVPRHANPLTGEFRDEIPTDEAPTGTEDSKLDQFVAKLGAAGSGERERAKFELEVAGTKGLEALVRNSAFKSSDKNVQASASEILNNKVNSYLGLHPDSLFGEALGEWNNETKGLPASVAKEMPRGLQDFARLVDLQI